jgi:membrane protease subunit (stomatin/prohibitin family)
MPGLIRGMARTAVVAGTATAVSGRVRRRQDSRWAQQEEQQYAEQQMQQAQQAPPPQQAAPAAAPAEGSVIDQLKELGELKAQGILTEEEFAAQKAKLLG